ncbi:HAD family hydrolase [Ancylobacter sp. WKF20]|uniref:HAD family hydrolase n=1 Tax=Ancylobacter sp. WKF20 TaxID=3039801 RepID=UPI0024341C38|nr:HAD family hydrolase [Ancylobacter sp. WKF20]WGD32144.1 HAD family hydrolase [Ancylobacter sp. WKF20]
MSEARTLRAILFDKDGTLLDYEKTWGGINRAAAALAGAGDPDLAARLLDIGGVDRSSGRTRPDSLLAAGNTREIAQAWVAAGSPHEVGALTRQLDDLFTQSAALAVPVTDLAALFGRLTARGLVLGIASSDSEAAIRATLRAFRVEGHVRVVIGYDSGFGSKPGPGMVLGFSALTGIAPAEIAVVGDNLHDMEMARAAGAGWRIGVLTGTGSQASLSSAADLCLPSIAALESDFLPAPVV